MAPHFPRGFVIMNNNLCSAHHIDTRSLQRFGVYVPRNTSVKTFINSAGTAPPSPAVFGKIMIIISALIFIVCVCVCI